MQCNNLKYYFKYILFEWDKCSNGNVVNIQVNTLMVGIDEDGKRDSVKFEGAYIALNLYLIYPWP